MARSTHARSNLVARWARRCALGACVYVAGSVGCSSDSAHNKVPYGEAGTGAGADAAGDGPGGAGNTSGSAGANTDAGTGTGANGGGGLSLGVWDSSSWDQALWQ